MDNWKQLVANYESADAACEAFWAAEEAVGCYSWEVIDEQGGPLIKAHSAALDALFNTPAPDLKALRDKLLIFQKQEPFSGWVAAPEYYVAILSDAAHLCPHLLPGDVA